MTEEDRGELDQGTYRLLGIDCEGTTLEGAYVGRPSAIAGAIALGEKWAKTPPEHAPRDLIVRDRLGRNVFWLSQARWDLFIGQERDHETDPQKTG